MLGFELQSRVTFQRLTRYTTECYVLFTKTVPAVCNAVGRTAFRWPRPVRPPRAWEVGGRPRPLAWASRPLVRPRCQQNPGPSAFSLTIPSSSHVDPVEPVDPSIPDISLTSLCYLTLPSATSTTSWRSTTPTTLDINWWDRQCAFGFTGSIASTTARPPRSRPRPQRTLLLTLCPLSPIWRLRVEGPSIKSAYRIGTYNQCFGTCFIKVKVPVLRNHSRCDGWRRLFEVWIRLFSSDLIYHIFLNRISFDRNWAWRVIRNRSAYPKQPRSSSNNYFPNTKHQCELVVVLTLFSLW